MAVHLDLRSCVIPSCPVCALSAVKIWLDRKVYIERASNAVSGFDDGVGWTFFDLTALHDECAGSPTTVLEADFYHAGKLLPLSDDELVAKVNQPACPSAEESLGLQRTGWG